MTRHRRLLAVATVALVVIAGGVAALLWFAPWRTTGSSKASLTAFQWQTLNEPGVGGRITSISVDPYDDSRVLVGGDILGVAFSNDGGASWHRATGFKSWEIADFTWSPTDHNQVWVGTMSGPYVSEDAGRTWSPRRNGLPPESPNSYSAPIQKVLFDPHSSTHLLAFGGNQRHLKSPGKPAWGAVWESHDDGRTWAKISTIADGAPVNQASYLAGSSADLLAATQDKGVYRSSDGGRTWTSSSSGLVNESPQNLVVDPSDSHVAWVSLGATGDSTGGIFKTDDGGSTWHAADAGLTSSSGSSPQLRSDYRALAVSPSKPNVLFTSEWGSHAIFRSLDGGTGWSAVLSGATFRHPYGTPPNADVVAIDPTDPAKVFMGTAEELYESTDGGGTWFDISSRATSDGRFVGTGFSGLVATRVTFNPFRAGDIVLSGFDGADFIQSQDGGKTWRRNAELPTWGGANDATFADADTVYVALGQRSFGGIARSSDDGTTWTTLAGRSTGLPATGGPKATSVQAVDAHTVVAVIGGNLYRSTDGGRTWTSGQSGLKLGDIAKSGNALYVTGAAGIYRSLDGGATLSLMPGSPKISPNNGRIASDSKQPKVLYATSWRASSGAGLYRFDGSTWKNINSDEMIYDVAVDPRNSSTLVAVTRDNPYHDVSRGEGVLLSTDGGKSWTVKDAGLGMTRLAAVAFDPFGSDLIVGSGGGGYYRTTVPS